MAITINEGTAVDVYTKLSSGTEIQVVKLDVGAGTAIADFGGTITSVTNLAFGTVDTFYRHPDRFATVVSTGTSVMGTVKGSVGGSAIYVTDLVISAGTATNVEIGDGGTSKPIVGTLHFATNGGAVINFHTPISTTAGSALVYKQSANGPLTITASGYVD